MRQIQKVTKGLILTYLNMMQLIIVPRLRFKIGEEEYKEGYFSNRN